jgi:hypothetical protein
MQPVKSGKKRKGRMRGIAAKLRHACGVAGYQAGRPVELAAMSLSIDSNVGAATASNVLMR